MTFLQTLQTVYGNTGFTVADAQRLADEYGLDAETALKAGETADGPIRTRRESYLLASGRVTTARWACFHNPNY